MAASALYPPSAVARDQQPYTEPQRHTVEASRYSADSQDREMPSYSGPQYHLEGGPAQGHSQDAEASRTRHMARTEPAYDRGDSEVRTPRYEGRNDVFFFPPNAVSAEAVQQRRNMIRRPSEGHSERSRHQQEDVVLGREGEARRRH